MAWEGREIEVTRHTEVGDTKIHPERLDPEPG